MHGKCLGLNLTQGKVSKRLSYFHDFRITIFFMIVLENYLPKTYIISWESLPNVNI